VEKFGSTTFQITKFNLANGGQTVLGTGGASAFGYGGGAMAYGGRRMGIVVRL